MTIEWHREEILPPPGGRVQETDVEQVLEDQELMIDVLSTREQRLRKTIKDALGKTRCICGVGIGHPQAPSHSPQCQELRKAVQYE